MESWSRAEKQKEPQELEKKYEDLVDLKEIFEKEFEKASKKWLENQDAHLTCLGHFWTDSGWPLIRKS